MGPLEWSLLVLLSILWGGSFSLVQIALRELPPFSLVCARMIITTVALAALALALGHSLAQPWRVWRSFAVMGFLNSLIPNSLNAWGQTQISSGLAAVLNASAPMFTVIFAHYFLGDEKMSLQKIIGVLLGIGGVAAIIGPRAMAGVSPALLGEIALLFAAMSMAMAGVFGRSLRKVPPLLSATGQAAWSMIFLIPLTLVTDHPWDLPMPGMATWMSVAGIALGGTALGYTIYFKLLASSGATNIILVTFLNPVTALIIGALFLGEIIEPRQLTGLLLIAAGLAAIDGRLILWTRARLSGDQRR